MLQRDYLMRIVQMAVQAIIDAVLKRQKEAPELTCEKLEDMLGQVADMDGGVLLALDPQSIGTMLELGGVMTDSTAELVVRALILESDILRTEVGDTALADLRFAQAQGIAERFYLDFESMREAVTEANVQEVTDDIVARASSS